MRPALSEKELFNPEEAILFYSLSRRKFYRFLQDARGYPFIAFYKNRKLIIRGKFEKYMRQYPEIMEGLKNGRAPVPKKA